MKKSVFKNTIFNVGYKVLDVFFPLITSMYVSRILGPVGIGRVAYVQNILSYFLVFASVGIPTYGIKEIARCSADKNARSRSFMELFLINAFTTSVCILAYILTVAFIPSFREDKLLFFAVGITLFLNYFNIDWFYAGIEKYVYITVRSTIVKLIALASLFLFVRTRSDVISYAAVSSFGLSANYILNIINIRKEIEPTLKQLSLKRHIRPVFILLFTMLATNLYNQIDITMMGDVCTESEIGYYSYALKLVRLVTSVAAAVSATMLPEMSCFYAEERYSELEAFANKVMSSVILIVAPCVVGVFLCSDNIVLILYGNEFLRTAALTRTLSPIIMVVSISYLCGSITLTAVNREKYLLLATIAGAIVNITLNALLIPVYKGDGAAIASLAAESCVLILHYIFARKYVKYRFFTLENGKVLISAAVLIMAVFLVQHYAEGLVFEVLLCALFGAFVYFFTLILLKNQIAIEGMNKIRGYFKKN